MSRISSMTIGLVLIFLGAQLYLVKSYLLTPTATRFVQEHFSSNSDSQFATPNPGSNGLFTNSGSNSWGGNSWAANGNSSGSIGQAPAGQKWPYYQTSGNAVGNTPGLFSNSSYQTPAASNGIHQFGSMNAGLTNGGKRFVPPRWIMWPALFMGAVFFLHGAALRN